MTDTQAKTLLIKYSAADCIMLLVHAVPSLFIKLKDSRYQPSRPWGQKRLKIASAV